MEAVQDRGRGQLGAQRGALGGGSVLEKPLPRTDGKKIVNTLLVKNSIVW